MKAGYAKVCITPPAGSRLTGFSARKEVSTGVHDDLFVRALVLEHGEKSVALLSVEVLALSAETVASIRDRVAAATGILPGDILVAATHTHSGPVTIRTFFNHHETPEPAYLNRLIEAAAASAGEAWRNRQAAQVGIGSCQVEGLGVNRREPESALVDRQAGIVRVDIAGETRAVAVIYGCHPTVLGFTNLQVSGDYPSAALGALEAALGPGAFAMFFNGAEANVSIGHSAELSLVGVMMGTRTFPHAQFLGERLAAAVLEALPSVGTCEALELATASVQLELAGRAYPPLAELKAARDEAGQSCATLAPDDPALLDARAKELYSSIDFANAERLRAHAGTIALELQGVRLGETLLLGISGEVFAETSLRLRELLPCPAFVIGMANGYDGYLPTAQAFAEGGYEVAVASCAVDSESRVLEAAVELERQLTAHPAGPRLVQA